MDASLRLQELCDRADITDIFVTYGEALDKRRWDLLEQIFLPDVEAHWAYGSAHQRGRDAVIAHIKRRLDTFATTHHQFGNYQMVFSDNRDNAFASCRARNYHAGLGEYSDLFVETLGTFEAQVVRTPEGWRVTEWRLLFHDRLHGTRGADWQPPTTS
jgi:hypothetical protein